MLRCDLPHLPDTRVKRVSELEYIERLFLHCAERYEALQIIRHSGVQSVIYAANDIDIPSGGLIRLVSWQGIHSEIVAESVPALPIYCFKHS